MHSFQSLMNRTPDSTKLAGFALILGLIAGAAASRVGIDGLCGLAYAAASLVVIYGNLRTPGYMAAWAVMATILAAYAAQRVFF